MLSLRGSNNPVGRELLWFAFREFDGVPVNLLQLKARQGKRTSRMLD